LGHPQAKGRLVQNAPTFAIDPSASKYFQKRRAVLRTQTVLPGIQVQTLAGALFGILVASGGLQGWAQEEEVLVGRNAAGQLKAEIGFSVLGLEASVFPGIPGYATGAVGFHSAAFDEPANDFFQLSPAGDFRFVLLAKDAGMDVWNDHGSGYMQVGDNFFIGQAPFDVHPIWNIVSGTPGQNYSLTLKVRDLNGDYTESDSFQLSFTPIPPVLTITNTSPGFFTISWAPDTRGFVLQSSLTLAPVAWSNAPSGSTNPITLPASALGQFYRVWK
jgi:hypothetical protein